MARRRDTGTTPTPIPNPEPPIHVRQRELICACIRSLSRTISYDDVKDLYERWKPGTSSRDKSDRRSMFWSDCERLVQRYQELVEMYLDPFFLPTPELHYDATAKRLRVVSGLRPIAAVKHEDVSKMTARRALARFVIGAQWPGGQGGPLIPRDGQRLFAGFGTAVCTVFRELIQAANSNLQTLTVHTNSMEVAGALYYRHQQAGAVAGLWLGDNVLVDRDEGAVAPGRGPESIDTAVVSYHAVRREGFFSTAANNVYQYSNSFLARAERIVIVAEHWKLGLGDGQPVDFPWAGKKPVLLVTDADPAQIDRHVPERVTTLRAT